MENQNSGDAQGQIHDDLFDYDVNLDSILAEPSMRSNINPNPPGTSNDGGLGLGLDDEVKVTKKRQPIAKLDENRLLSQAGIPKLRRTAKQKLKFKGKGHEFSDAARLLNFYQLWLDDLFPRAKFMDGLAMIEKLGHSKRIQTMRKEWIDEEKPRASSQDDEQPQRIEDIAVGENNDDGLRSPADLRPEHATNSAPQRNDDSNDLFISDEGNPEYVVDRGDALEEDDLEALLREQDEAMPPAIPADESRYADDMEAMGDMDIPA
ncbi:replication fork protection component Swi3-domain-containing protein [Aspergillus ambiguus]|uniref:Chromosome segregation in meiosis protein 3 n=1 Tax=Aspergillus ambiguus TaxID=176160 RepID=UPI003CCCD5AE